MKHVMIDLETMGLSPGCAITQIGACFFDLNTLTFGNTFQVNIDLISSCEMGFVLEPHTVDWWMRQDRKAATWLKGAKTALDATLKLTRFLAEQGDP